MTTVPTPSDSQDGARRRDDAALIAAVAQALRDDVDPELESCFEGADREDECFRAHIHLGSSIEGVIRTVYANPDRVAELAALALRPHFEDLRADVARLEAERDAMRGVVEAVRALHKPTLQTVEWFHDQTGNGEALCCPSCRPEEPSEWDPPIGWAGVEPEGFVPSYTVSPCPTLAAVDQTTPSSPQETPHTADGGEAWVVEGAGGSEAAEGVTPTVTWADVDRYRALAHPHSGLVTPTADTAMVKLAPPTEAGTDG